MVAIYDDTITLVAPGAIARTEDHDPVRETDTDTPVEGDLQPVSNRFILDKNQKQIKVSYEFYTDIDRVSEAVVLAAKEAIVGGVTYPILGRHIHSIAIEICF